MKTPQIICTIGPSSEKKQVLTKMMKNGMDVARLNFSHGSYENHAMLIKNIREVAKKLKKKVLILQDLQGPKIRIGELKKSFIAKTKGSVTIGKDITIDADVAKFLKPGQRIFIQDGLIQLKVKKVAGGLIHCAVINGGKIQSHKGVNLPDTKLDLSSLTPKDIQDLQFGLKHNVDLVAISFVRSVKDIAFLKKQIAKSKGKKIPKTVAKIEKPEAVKNINSIIKAVDLVMVARGDLGVEMPEEKVPAIQKSIIEKCNRAKKPVIVATQMLESMVSSPRPTRAEVEDVADAVLEGTNYTMLSEETASGQYPVEAVTEMHKIIAEVSKK